MQSAMRIVTALATAFLVALVVVACGEGEAGEPAPAATEAATTPAVSETAATPASPREDVPSETASLHIGAVLPETGSLAFLAVPVVAAVRMAVEDVNAAGGNVTLTLADSATSPSTGREGVRRLLGEGAHAIVGAGASNTSQAFIQILFDERVPQCSPSNTSPVFTTQENAAYYFRTVPPDTAMAPLIADLVVGRGATRIGVIGRADAWGNALNALLQAEFAGLGAETHSVLYDPETASYSAEVASIVNYDPDIVINLGFRSDGSETVRQLIEAGVGPERQLATSGLYSPTLWQEVDASNPAVLDGMLGVAQAVRARGEFATRLTARTGDDYLAYSAEGYDCVILLALAARIVGDPSDGEAMMAAIRDLTRDGDPCDSYASCAALIDAGRAIDYSGKSGPINLNAVGDPTVGVYSVWTWEDGGTPVLLGDQTVDLAASE